MSRHWIFRANTKDLSVSVCPRQQRQELPAGERVCQPTRRLIPRTRHGRVFPAPGAPAGGFLYDQPRRDCAFTP